MKNEKMYVVPKSMLINLLICEMECEMNDRDGVDNWGWYGHSYNSVIRDFYPGDEIPEDTDMYSCAQARLEAGEFQEQIDTSELLGNIFDELNFYD